MAKTRTKPVTGRFVLDCSMATAWLLIDEVTDYSDSVHESLKTTVAEAPSLWPYEIANVLYISMKRKRCSETDIAQWIKLLCRLPIELESTSREMVLLDVLPYSLRSELTAYDAAYLELADRKSLPLATLDHKLISAAMKLGIDRYDPAELLGK